MHNPTPGPFFPNQIKRSLFDPFTFPYDRSGDTTYPSFSTKEEAIAYAKITGVKTILLTSDRYAAYQRNRGMQTPWWFRPVIENSVAIAMTDIPVDIWVENIPTESNASVLSFNIYRF